MTTQAAGRISQHEPLDLSEYLPKELHDLEDLQTAIPRIAKDSSLLKLIRQAAGRIPSKHTLVRGDARDMDIRRIGQVHLVLTSPPYWTLKEYRDAPGQMGHIADYDEFVRELNKVWKNCFDLLIPGGRLVCVVGDVCLSRRKNDGLHTVVPLHASIQENCREIGFDNLAPIIWHKIANAVYEVENGGGGFLGKPYEPNAVVKNDIEFILMERKPGGYRTPTSAERILSVIGADEHRQWFQQIWEGVTGASTKNHPAPYPVELAERLIRMFSFVGDAVLDPFMGTGTTALAASKWGRNTVNFEVDKTYMQYAVDRLHRETSSLFSSPEIVVKED